MSPNENGNVWYKMNEMTLEGCKAAEGKIESASSNSLDDETGNTPRDETFSATSAQIVPEASVSPHATTKPVICHCNCTRKPRGVLADDSNIIQLRQDINRLSSYALATSPNLDMMVLEVGSPRSSIPQSMDGVNPYTPRTYLLESPMDIQNRFREYQSDEDSTSDEDDLEYTLSRTDTAGTLDRRSGESIPRNSQDMPDTEGTSDVEHRQSEEDSDSDEGL
ncbi:hypothetical protein EG329_011684 [Mollisiaceae sp. DMI_Dod_QoI]|nr:hypothetical protein EG329_011684 [Helotiales sp. DMI_Dod_QoI]